MKTVDLLKPELYINRELSLLAFNRRVMELAQDPSTPLLERLKFLCITSNNLDEFFEIRVAALKQQVAYGSVQRGPDNLGVIEQLQRVAAEAHALVGEQYATLNTALLPQLRSQGIRFLARREWIDAHRSWVKQFFSGELLPVLSPLGLDPAHPFPQVLNKSLNFLVPLEGKDAFGRNSGVAVVQAPRSLPRVIAVPAQHTEGEYDFVLLSSIIHAHINDLFPGMHATGCYQFRVTRNSHLFVDDEAVDDLKLALEGELAQPRFGEAVRLEVVNDCPADMRTFLMRQFTLGEDDVYACDGPVNLMRLMAVPDLVDRPDLKYPDFTPSLTTQLAQNSDLFEAIRQGDVLLHHPFQSFAPVVEFVRQAASDPSVLAIKQTLYRTEADSAPAQALVDAARAGKEVTVVIELLARFDEQANIALADQLQAAGAHVVYGVVGHKTHAKMLLVLRREGRALRRYVHLGTGNYHTGTARAYTDFGLLSSENALGEDVHKVFQQLTALGKAGKLKQALQSPFTLHRAILDYIKGETELARKGEKARIIAKMNALIEPEIIQALYVASRAGVKIDLIIRGICALRPGIKGVSENISVRSVVGRFLEHARVFYFYAAGREHVYLSSADWMGRNFFNRVELAVPVHEETLKKRVIKEGLMEYLGDNQQAWVLNRDGSYHRLQPGSNKPRGAQAGLLAELAGE